QGELADALQLVDGFELLRVAQRTKAERRRIEVDQVERLVRDTRRAPRARDVQGADRDEEVAVDPIDWFEWRARQDELDVGVVHQVASGLAIACRQRGGRREETLVTFEKHLFVGRDDVREPEHVIAFYLEHARDARTYRPIRRIYREGAGLPFMMRRS